MNRYGKFSLPIFQAKNCSIRYVGYEFSWRRNTLLDTANSRLMNALRKNWYDYGGLLAALLAIYILLNRNSLTNYQLLMWLSLLSLFLHQLEEYRIVGTFPGMVNSVMYNSKIPDRYPLNTNTSFYVNVAIGWTTYFLAAIFAENAIWLGMATMVISIGNILAHTIVFNIKGRTIYNAGLASSWLLFTPCTYFFFYIIAVNKLATQNDYIFGIALGMLLNIVGILKLIDWMADKNTSYVFDERNLLPKDRQKT
jgi:hypothetical protein